jgi:hypothetical protein
MTRDPEVVIGGRRGSRPPQSMRDTAEIFPILPQPGQDTVSVNCTRLVMSLTKEAASVGCLFHDSLDNGPRGAWSFPPVR